MNKTQKRASVKRVIWKPLVQTSTKITTPFLELAFIQTYGELTWSSNNKQPKT